MPTRQDDVFLRRLIISTVIGCVIAMIANAALWIYYVGRQENRIDNLEDKVFKLENSYNELIKVDNRLIRIEVLTETVIVGNIALNKNYLLIQKDLNDLVEKSNENKNKINGIERDIELGNIRGAGYPNDNKFYNRPKE